MLRNDRCSRATGRDRRPGVSLALVRAAAHRSVRGAMAFALGLIGCGDLVPGDEKLPRSVLVKYERTGGIGGFEDEIRIERDGRATFLQKLKAPKTVQLSHPTVRRLEDALERADFDRLKPSYGGNSFPDAVQIAISYRDRTVRGGELPPELGPALRILSDLLAREIYNKGGR